MGWQIFLEEDLDEYNSAKNTINPTHPTLQPSVSWTVDPSSCQWLLVFCEWGDQDFLFLW